MLECTFTPRLNDNATKRIYISCNAGSVLRPLAVVKDGKPLMSVEIIEKVTKKFLSWTDLLYMGIVELVDANEEENCYVAIDIKKHRECPYPFRNISIRNSWRWCVNYSLSRTQSVTTKYL